LATAHAVLKMGQEGAMTPDSRRLTIDVAGCRRLAKIEVLRNCQVVHEVVPGSRFGTFEWEDVEDLAALLIRETPFGDAPFLFYYVRVTQEDGHRAWGSPVWLHTPPGLELT
jgi:hypothetical protein